MQDFYEALEVGRDAGSDDIKRAYRRLAREHHPDRNPGDASAEQKFKEISQAYEVLKDPERRSAYDQMGHAAFEQGFRSAGGDFGADFGNVGDIFDNLFRDFMGGGGRRAAARGADLRYDLTIDLEDAYHGVERRIRYPASVACEACRGTGAREGTGRKTCGTCGGRGHVASRHGILAFQQTCPACGGQGSVIAEPCSACNGLGRVHRQRTVSVQIVPGVDTGTRIRLGGEGEAGPPGGEPGDLYVFMNVEPHELYQREGDHLLLEVPVSFDRAALGDELVLPTLDGNRIKVRIPPGVQSGHRFRVRGKGMPRLRLRGRGDLFVEVQVEIPVKLDAEQRRLLGTFAHQASPSNFPRSETFRSRIDSGKSS